MTPTRKGITIVFSIPDSELIRQEAVRHRMSDDDLLRTFVEPYLILMREQDRRAKKEEGEPS